MKNNINTILVKVLILFVFIGFYNPVYAYNDYSKKKVKTKVNKEVGSLQKKLNRRMEGLESFHLESMQQFVQKIQKLKSKKKYYKICKRRRYSIEQLVAQSMKIISGYNLLKNHLEERKEVTKNQIKKDSTELIKRKKYLRDLMETINGNTDGIARHLYIIYKNSLKKESEFLKKESDPMEDLKKELDFTKGETIQIKIELNRMKEDLHLQLTLYCIKYRIRPDL